MHHHMMAIDRITRTIIWHTNLTDWPKILPLSTDIQLRKMPGIPADLYPHLANYQVITDWSYKKYELVEQPLRDLNYCQLMNMKCRASWNMLNFLHDLQRISNGPLPNIFWTKTDAVDHQLSVQEKNSIEQIINEYVERFYQRIWKSTSMEEITQVGIDASLFLREYVIYQ